MDPTHAGGVVFRRIGANAEYLLVGPSKDQSNVWVLPKGHIKKGETPEQAAGREVREEAGVVADINCFLGTIEFMAGEKIVRAKFYLMRFRSQETPIETRRRGWFPLNEASARATHPKTKALLQKAAQLVPEYHRAA